MIRQIVYNLFNIFVRVYGWRIIPFCRVLSLDKVFCPSIWSSNFKPNYEGVHLLRALRYSYVYSSLSKNRRFLELPQVGSKKRKKVRKCFRKVWGEWQRWWESSTTEAHFHNRVVVFVLQRLVTEILWRRIGKRATVGCPLDIILSGSERFFYRQKSILMDLHRDPNSELRPSAKPEATLVRFVAQYRRVESFSMKLVVTTYLRTSFILPDFFTMAPMYFDLS